MDKTLLSHQGVRVMLLKQVTLTLLQGICIVLQAYYLSNAISSFFRGDLFHIAFYKIAIFLLALFLRQILVSYKRNIAFHFAARTSKNKRATLLKHLFELGPRFVREEGTGQTVTLVMEGIPKFQHYLEMIYIKTINTLLVPMMLAVFIAFFNMRSALILLVSVPILIIFMVLLGLAAKAKADRQYQSYQMLSNHFLESMRGLETLKYLGFSKHHMTNIAQISEKYRRSTLETLKVAFLSSFAMDFFTMLSIATVAVFLGLGLIKGTISLHHALFILILAPEYYLPIRELGADYHATLDGRNVGDKITDLLKQQPHIKKDIILPNVDPKTISFIIKDLNVHFPDNPNAGLHNLNFSAKGPRKIGIIGASGAGKTTFIETISGFLTPTSGEFLINETSLSTFANTFYQNQVMYISQSPHIFNLSIMDNIRFFYPNASIQEIENAISMAGLSSFVHSLPQGMNTLIGEGGRNLSGGQAQRIALARAFLGNHPIIILDEPTAHLDLETEAELKEHMLQLFQNKLVFFATHRLHWMMDMDDILVMDKGEIVESGTHQELKNTGSVYQKLLKIHMEEY